MTSSTSTSDLPDALLERADQLAAEQRCLDAIDLLQHENRALRDPWVEERLVELRRDAVGELDPAADPPRPTFDDPFPGRTDLIDIPAAQATPDIVGGAIQHHGCILVRGLLSPEHAEMLRNHIDTSFDALLAAHDGAPLEQTRPWFVPLAPHPDRPVHQPESRGNPQYMAVCTVDSPRTMFDLIAAYEDDGVHDIVRALLGTRPVLTGHKWSVRKMKRRKLKFWHQERSVFAQASEREPQLRTVNVWMALSEAGQNAPGFEVLPRRETEVHPMKQRFAISEEVFDQIHDRDYTSPLYGPGDAMIFDEMLVHRTKSEPSMTGTRYSVEAWYFTPGGLPERDAVVL